jgi:hypothetical protein
MTFTGECVSVSAAACLGFFDKHKKATMAFEKNWFVCALVQRGQLVVCQAERLRVAEPLEIIFMYAKLLELVLCHVTLSK